MPSSSSKKLIKTASNGADKQLWLTDREMLKQLYKTIHQHGDLIQVIKRRVNSGNPQNRARALKPLQQLENGGVKLSTMERFYKIALGQIFKVYIDDWDKLPKHFVQAYPEGCYAYIQQKYGVGEQMANMYSTVWEALYSGEHVQIDQIPKFVRLSEIPVAKQRVAATYIMDGEMSKQRWQALADETLDRHELSVEMRKGSDKLSPGRPVGTDQLVIIQETGDLRLYDHGKIEEVGFLNIRNSNPRVRQRIRQIIKRNKIKTRR